jgi:uncharacterized membrane protein
MDKEQKTIMNLYGAFAASIICNFIPLAVVQGFGICLLLIVLIAAYIYKARAKLDSLTYNHTTYLIGTIWVSSFLLLIGMMTASYWVYMKGDHTLIQNLMAATNSGIVPTPDDMEATLRGYIHQNMKLLITATATTIGPGMIYMIYRTVCGLSRASKGYRMAKPAGWF